MKRDSSVAEFTLSQILRSLRSLRMTYFFFVILSLPPLSSCLFSSVILSVSEGSRHSEERFFGRFTPSE